MAQLQDATGWDKATYKDFRTFVRGASAETGLNPNNRTEQQDSQKWATFRNKVLAGFPALNNYANHWPLNLYYNRWVSDRIHHKRDTETTKLPSVTVDHEQSCYQYSDSDEDVPLSRQRTQDRPEFSKSSVESDSDDLDEIPVKRKSKTARSLDETPPRIYIGKDPSTFSRHPCHYRLASSRSNLLESEFEKDSDSSSTRRRISSVRNPSSDLLSRSPAHEWPVYCVFCGIPPIVPESCTKELRELFQEDVVAVLLTVGLLHDLHLRILAALEESQRQAFLLSLVPEHFTQFMACEISEVIDGFAKDHVGENLPTGELEACSRHRNQALEHDGVPSQLQLTLEVCGMEELGPVAVFLGIDSNARLRAMRTFKPEMKKAMMFDNMKEVKPSLFQIFMLEWALAPAS